MFVEIAVHGEVGSLVARVIPQRRQQANADWLSEARQARRLTSCHSQHLLPRENIHIPSLVKHHVQLDSARPEHHMPGQSLSSMVSIP